MADKQIWVRSSLWTGRRTAHHESVRAVWRSACALLLICVSAAITCSAQTFTDLWNFAGNDGQNPQFLALVQGSDGDFYGTARNGGANLLGTVFKVTSGGVLSTIHDFDGSDGASPHGTLLLNTDGNFYGTTLGGGADQAGTVFKITPAGIVTTLYGFAGPDGAGPQDGLVRGTDGNLYGTTNTGGKYGGGTVFKVSLAGALTTLHNFNPSSEGAHPLGGLMQATDGKFYGTTQYGGAFNDGTIFKITHAGKLTTLYTFSGPDGADPFSVLLQASDGNLYGTTNIGGAHNGGTVFKILPGGTLTTLYSFCALDQCTDGAYPIGALIQATDGSFYGTCANLNHGAKVHGTVFKLSPDGNLTTLHSFQVADGSAPHSALLQATSGVFYGNTYAGGSHNLGTVFSLDTGLGPFVSLPTNYGKAGQKRSILGQGFIGATRVSFNGTKASFRVKSDTLLVATVPSGAMSGLVTVSTPGGKLTSNKPFLILP